MNWDIIKNLNLEIGQNEYQVNLANTKFNLLYEIQQTLFGHVFFGINYWPEIARAFQEILQSSKESNGLLEKDVFIDPGRKTKLTLTYKKNSIRLARKISDANRSTWMVQQDSNRRGGLPRVISFSIASSKEFSQLQSLVNSINQIHEEIQSGKIKQPEFGGYGLFYPNEMEKSDRSLISFKKLLDDELFTCFIRLDENKNNSEMSARIARATVAREAKENGIQFLDDKRYDDGFISFDGIELSFDWEIRRDWYGNLNNIAIRYVDKKNVYFAVDYPPPAPGSDQGALSKEFENVIDVIDFLQNSGLKENKPYFIYKTLGQFERKIQKDRIVLTLQCSQAAPLWPILETQLGYFVAAWHIDFRTAGTVKRTTQNHVGEMGVFYDCNNFGIFPFNQSGVLHFKENIREQFRSGTIEDSRGNLVPRKREWF